MDSPNNDNSTFDFPDDDEFFQESLAWDGLEQPESAAVVTPFIVVTPTSKNTIKNTSNQQEPQNNGTTTRTLPSRNSFVKRAMNQQIDNYNVDIDLFGTDVLSTDPWVSFHNDDKKGQNDENKATDHGVLKQNPFQPHISQPTFANFEDDVPEFFEDNGDGGVDNKPEDDEEGHHEGTMALQDGARRDDHKQQQNLSVFLSAEEVKSKRRDRSRSRSRGRSVGPGATSRRPRSVSAHKRAAATVAGELDTTGKEKPHMKRRGSSRGRSYASRDKTKSNRRKKKKNVESLEDNIIDGDGDNVKDKGKQASAIVTPNNKRDSSHKTKKLGGSKPNRTPPAPKRLLYAGAPSGRKSGKSLFSSQPPSLSSSFTTSSLSSAPSLALSTASSSSTSLTSSMTASSLISSFSDSSTANASYLSKEDQKDLRRANVMNALAHYLSGGVDDEANLVDSVVDSEEHRSSQHSSKSSPIETNNNDKKTVITKTQRRRRSISAGRYSSRKDGTTFNNRPDETFSTMGGGGRSVASEPVAMILRTSKDPTKPKSDSMLSQSEHIPRTPSTKKRQGRRSSVATSGSSNREISTHIRRQSRRRGSVAKSTSTTCSESTTPRKTSRRKSVTATTIDPNDPLLGLGTNSSSGIVDSGTRRSRSRSVRNRNTNSSSNDRRRGRSSSRGPGALLKSPSSLCVGGDANSSFYNPDNVGGRRRSISGGPDTLLKATSELSIYSTGNTSRRRRSSSSGPNALLKATSDGSIYSTDNTSRRRRSSSRGPDAPLKSPSSLCVGGHSNASFYNNTNSRGSAGRLLDLIQ